MKAARRRVLVMVGVLGALGSVPPAASAATTAPWQVRPRARSDTTSSDTIPGSTGAPVGPQYVLEPIVVTAERERSTAPPVTTITVDPVELRVVQSENPYDLIRRVTGLEVHDQGQGPGFASNVVLRGFTADHSSDLLLVVDGVPVNLPVHGHIEGYADWNYLFPGAISSMRVIHGPSSPLHGDFAIAGAIEVYTKADADGMAGQLSANAFGDVSGWVTTGTRGDRGGGLVGLELRRLDGWRDRSAQTVGNALLRGWRSVGEGRLEGGIAVHGARWESPGFLSLADYESGRLDRVADRTDGGEQGRVAVHGRYAVPVASSTFLQITGWGVVSDWDLYLTSPGHEDALGSLYQSWESDRRWGTGGQAELSWLPSAGELTFGVSGRLDGSAYDQRRTLRRVAIEDHVALDAGHASASAYARWRWHPVAWLGVDLGARVDHLHNRTYNRLGLEETASASPFQILAEPLPLYLHDIEIGGPVGEWVSGGQTIFGPKLGAELRLSRRWALMASSSRGFRSAVGVVGDPERPPVVAWAQELGLDFDGSRLAAHVSLFRTDVSNERIQDPITLVISSSGSSVRQGVEAMADLRLDNGVRIFGRGTYTDAMLSGRYADAHEDHGQGHEGEIQDSEGQLVPGIARYVGQLSIESPLLGELRGRLEGRVTGPYVPIGESEVRTDPYATIDAGVSYPIHPGLLVELEGRNLLDAVYPEMRSSGYVSPGTPRSLGLTLNVLEGTN